MANFDWHKIMFLESSTNLKRLLKQRIGRTPNTTIAREIAVCLQQGRLFYDAALSSPLEIKPLQLFYGMVGFAKALILSNNLCSLSSLSHSHGLSDVSSQTSKLSELKIKIGNTGTFQEFNNVMSALNRVTFYDHDTRPTARFIPASASDKLASFELTLVDLLSRIPGLEDIYRITFPGSEPNSESILLDITSRYGGTIAIMRIDDRVIFTNQDDLRGIVNKWRTRFPFLRKWRIISAQHSWGNSVIEFSNIENQEADDFESLHHQEQDNSFKSDGDPRYSSEANSVDFLSILDPLAGGYSGSCNVVSPLGGNVHISEFSLHYMTLFLLSSLVRYRPQTWGHALSRTATSEMPPDDEMLALIDRFMDLNQNLVPSMVSTVINPYDDKYSYT